MVSGHQYCTSHLPHQSVSMICPGVFLWRILVQLAIRIVWFIRNTISTNKQRLPIANPSSSSWHVTCLFLNKSIQKLFPVIKCICGERKFIECWHFSPYPDVCDQVTVCDWAASINPRKKLESVVEWTTLTACLVSFIRLGKRLLVEWLAKKWCIVMLTYLTVKVSRNSLSLSFSEKYKRALQLWADGSAIRDGSYDFSASFLYKMLMPTHCVTIIRSYRLCCISYRSFKLFL